MRILHTSDWHVGKTLRGRSRLDEHREVLAEIARVAAEEDVDLVLVTGDLFESAAPLPDAQRVVWDALLALRRTGAEVVVIGGNHDNQHAFDAWRPLFAAAGITMLGHATRPELGGVVECTTRAGEPAVVVLVPFVSQRYAVRTEQLLELDAAEASAAYTERMRRLITSLCGAFRPDAVNVLAAHCFVRGGRVGGGRFVLERACSTADRPLRPRAPSAVAAASAVTPPVQAKNARRDAFGAAGDSIVPGVSASRAGVSAISGAPIDRSRCSDPIPAATPSADAAATAPGDASSSARPVTTPITPKTTKPASARRGWRRATIPNSEPMARQMRTIPVSSAGLSLVPNSSTAGFFRGPAKESMNHVPTLVTSDEPAGSATEPTMSAVAKATAAAIAPARADRPRPGPFSRISPNSPTWLIWPSWPLSARSETGLGGTGPRSSSLTSVPSLEHPTPPRSRRFPSGGELSCAARAGGDGEEREGEERSGDDLGKV